MNGAESVHPQCLKMVKWEGIHAPRVTAEYGAASFDEPLLARSSLRQDFRRQCAARHTPMYVISPIIPTQAWWILSLQATTGADGQQRRQLLAKGRR
jgi:hypothetical protein